MSIPFRPAVIIALLWLPMAAPPAASQEVKIGLALPVVGPFAAIGGDVDRGFRAHLSDIGSQVGNVKLTVIKEDTEGKPDVGLTKVRKLVERDEVAVVTGIVSSAVGLAIKPYIDSKQVPLLLQISSTDDITMKNRSPWVFRTVESSMQSMYPYGQWVARKLGKKRAIIFTSNFVTGHVQGDAFAKGFTDGGGQVVEKIHPPVGTVDFAPFLAKIDPGKADMVFVFVPTDIVRFFQQYEEYGLKAKLPVIGGSGQPDTLILKNVGKSAVGTIVGDNYAVDADTPENKHFVNVYRARHGTLPSEWSYMGYVGGMAVTQAIRLAGTNLTRAGLREALSRLDFNGPRGPIKMDENGQTVGRLYVTEVIEKDGQFAKRTVDVLSDLMQAPAYRRVVEGK